MEKDNIKEYEVLCILTIEATSIENAVAAAKDICDTANFTDAIGGSCFISAEINE